MDVVGLIVGAIAIGMTFLYGCVGEIITEKAGHLNLGIPGIMTLGACGGCFGVSLYMKNNHTNPEAFLLFLTAIVFAILFAVALGLVYAFFTVSLKANQNVTGLTLTTFGVGITQFLIEGKIDRTYFAQAAKIISKSLDVSKLGWFGEIFLSHGVLVYLAIVIAIVATIVLSKTKVGLNLRAVGENPATADAVGLNVTAYKYVAILVGSSIAGLGGLYYIMDYLYGSWEYGIEALGWISIALVIFTMWRPALSILGSIIFGALYIIAYKINGISPSQMNLIKLVPYVVTVIVLIITSVFDSKETQPPAALGTAYFREDR